jgi:hypothetical protein
MATTSALDIENNVRDVFIPVLGKLEEVGPHHSSTWDPLFLKLLLLRHAMAHVVDVPASALEEVAAGLGEFAAAEGLMQSLRTSAAPAARRVATALAVRSEEEDGLLGDPGSYLVEDWDTYGVFAVGATAVGAARFRPPPDCPTCGKPSVAGSDYLTCCKAWLVQPMFCNLCHSATRAATFGRSGCRGR